MSKIPNEVIDKMKLERKEQYDSGFADGVEFATSVGYAVVDKVVDTIREEGIPTEVLEILQETKYLEGSSEYKEGFADALEEILNKSKERE